MLLNVIITVFQATFQALLMFIANQLFDSSDDDHLNCFESSFALHELMNDYECSCDQCKWTLVLQFDKL
jgi:hypothetical protein